MRGAVLLFVLLIISSISWAGCIQGDCHSGMGVYVYANGDRYSGDFRGSLPEGKGVKYYANGDKYLGMWHRGLREGKGKWIIAHRGTYIGHFHRDMRMGQGTMVYLDGHKYEGKWLNDLPSNLPTSNAVAENVPASEQRPSSTPNNPPFHTPETAQKESPVPNNPPFHTRPSHKKLPNCNKEYCDEVQGEYVYKDGSRWVGYFVDGRPQGNGTCYYSNGDRYTGGWSLNAPQGEGVMYYATGKIYGAVWNRGKPLRPLQKKESFEALTDVAPHRDKAVRIWAGIVGVSSYTHMPALRYSDDDAYRMYAFLKSPEGGAVPERQIKILIDEDASRNRILKTLQEVFYQADENDMVLLYYSGHGLKGSFIPIDYDGFNNRISHEEVFKIFNKSKAKYKVCYADACYSGSMTAMKSVDINTELRHYYHQLENTKQGVAFLLSSKGEEYSLEDRGLRQGVFTHYLIRGLKGEADTDRNKLVTINELYRFVRWGVRDYTGNLQTPVIMGNYDRHMPLAMIRKQR